MSLPVLHTLSSSVITYNKFKKKKKTRRHIMPNNKDSFYTLLGINRNADQKAIRKAYKKAALKHHPDRGGNEEIFKKVSQAYEVLSDKTKRSLYDQFGEEGLKARPSSEGPNTQFPGGGEFTTTTSGFSQEDAHKIFEQFFGGNLKETYNFNAFGGTESSNSKAGRGLGGSLFNDISPKFFSEHMNLGGTGSSTFGAFGFPFGFDSDLIRERKSQKPNLCKNILPRQGVRVKIKNISNSPALNDRIGTVSGSHNGRSIITLDQSGAQVALKIENILQLVPVTISGLKNRPELNGSRAQITGIRPIDGRIEVSTNGSIMALKKENIIYPKNTIVKMEDLNDAQQFNGKVGRIQKYDSTKNRYVICVDSHQHIFVRPRNVSI